MRIGSKQWQRQDDGLQSVVGVQDGQNGVRQLLLLLEAECALPTLQQEGTDQPPSARRSQAAFLARPEEVDPGLLRPLPTGWQWPLLAIEPSQWSVRGRLLLVGIAETWRDFVTRKKKNDYSQSRSKTDY